MAQNYKTGLIITGDASGGIRAIKATDTELGKLNQGFDRGSRRSKQFSQDVNSTSRGLDTLKTSAGGVAAAMATAFGAGSIINQARLIADTDSLAKSIGMATGDLQAWDYAAQQAGLAGGQMGDILKDITERIGEFTAEGTGEAAALFENLNLDIEEMKRLSPDQQLLRIAEAISTLETRGEKISYLERLGSDATRLLPLLDNNAALLRENINEAKALNVAMSQVDIENAVQANRAMMQLTGTMDGFINQVVADLGPGLATGVGGLTDFIQEVGGAGRIINEVKDVATLTAVVMAGRFTASMVDSTRKMIERNVASAAAAAADERSMQMAARRAAAEVTSTKRLLGRAVAEAQATKGTDAHTAALARLGVARQQAIAAAAQYTVAVNANSAAMGRATIAAHAMAGATRAGSAALALVGGPMGAAVIAGAAAYYFRDSLGFASAAARETREEVDQLVESMDNYTEAQYRNNRVSIVQDLAEARIEAEKLERQVAALQEQSQQESIIYQGRPGAASGQLSGLMADLQEQNRIVAANEEGLREYDQAWQDVLQSQISGVSIFRTLDQWLDEIGSSADSAGNSVNDGAPSDKTIEAWEKYNEQLRDNLAVNRDPSAVGAANRELDKLGVDDPIRRGITVGLALQEDELERQKELQKEAADAARQAASDAERAAQKRAQAAERANQESLRQYEEFQDSLQSLQDRLFPLEAAQRQYREEQELTVLALARGEIGTIRYLESIERLEASTLSAKKVGEAYGVSTDRTANQVNQSAQDLGFAFESAFESAILQGEGLRSVLGGIAEDIARITLRQTVTAPIGNWVSGAVGGLFGGSGESIAGGFLSQIGGYADGGYTGAGGRLEPAGVVHRGEFVVQKRVVEQPGVRPMLEALNQGVAAQFANGGYVVPALPPALPSLGIGRGYADGGYVNAPGPANLEQFNQTHNNSSQSVSLSVSVPVTVQAAPGMNQEQAQQQGQAIGKSVEGAVVRVLQRELRHGGILHKR